MYPSENISELNLQQWLSLLESRHPSEIDLGLDRIHVVAQTLECVEFSCPVALVAGTNGKGSCVEMLKQLALSKGLKVATYTSPHLLIFNERICINGIPVSDSVLVNAFVKVEQARLKSFYKQAVASLTYFEFTTLAALYIFQNAQVDCLILEVGLGGRLDAVNIVEPHVSVITSIGIDHELWLGKDRSSIAREKAGIARAHKPCIVGEQDLPDGLLETLHKKNAQVLLLQNDFYFEKNLNGVFIQLVNPEHASNKNDMLLFNVNQMPRLALQNCVTALQAFLYLGYPLTESEIAHAFRNARLAGRCEVFPATANSPTVICDLAHNPAGALFFKGQLEQLVKSISLSSSLDASGTVSGIKIAIIVGVMADKDFVGMLQPFSDWDTAIDTWFCCDLDLPRAAKSGDLAALIKSRFNGKVVCQASPQQALESSRAADFDLILVFGSFFTLAPIYPLLGSSGQVSG